MRKFPYTLTLPPPPLHRERRHVNVCERSCGNFFGNRGHSRRLNVCRCALLVRRHRHASRPAHRICAGSTQRQHHIISLRCECAMCDVRNDIELVRSCKQCKSTFSFSAHPPKLQPQLRSPSAALVVVVSGCNVYGRIGPVPVSAASMPQGM